MNYASDDTEDILEKNCQHRGEIFSSDEEPDAMDLTHSQELTKFVCTYII